MDVMSSNNSVFPPPSCIDHLPTLLTLGYEFVRKLKMERLVDGRIA
jgi:hypothetical protein